MPTRTDEHFVYHVTTTDRAEQCVVEGILPYHTTLARDETLERDKTYDASRPDHVIDLGVARANSVYAHPGVENALSRHNGGWLNHAQTELAVLSIFVPNLDEAFVADGLLVGGGHSPDEFWASITTLEAYRASDHPTFVGPHNRPYSEMPTRFIYMWPEVLLPGGVAPENITWDKSQSQVEMA